jgi:CHAT domain-containing protein/Tfp pilus assembly protein PilF
MSRSLILSGFSGSALALLLTNCGLWAQPVRLPASTGVVAEAELTQLQGYTKELAPGQSDWYSLGVAEGEFVEIEVRPPDLDVHLSPAGPDAVLPDPIEVPRGAGVRTIIYIAQSTGKHLLEIAARETTAPRRYEVKIGALRAATGEDRERLKAGQLILDGDTALRDGTLSSVGRAVMYFEEALVLWRKVQEPHGVVKTLGNLGRAHAALGEYQHAIENFKEAVQESDTLNDLQIKAAALTDLGERYFDSGEYLKALDVYTQVRLLRFQLNDRGGEAAAFIRMGTAHRELGDTQEALDQLAGALATTRTLADKKEQAGALNQLGLVYTSLGQPEKAIESFMGSLPLLRAVGYERGEAYALNNIADAYSKLGRNTVSRDYLIQAQRKMAAVKDRRGEALVYSNIAEVEGRLGDTTQAEEHMIKALTLRRELGDVRGEGYTLKSLGDLKASHGDYAKAAEYLGQSAAIRDSIHDWNGQAAALYSLARLEFGKGNLDEAQKRMVHVLQLVERFRQGVVNEALRSTYFASIQQYYEFSAAVLMQMDRAEPSKGYSSLAFDVSERARARTLVDALNTANIDPRREVDQRLFLEEREVEAAISAKAEIQARLQSGHRNEEDGALGAEIDSLLDRYYDLQAKIRASNPRFSEIVNPRPLRLAEIQNRVLDNDTILLEFMLSSGHSYVWCVTNVSVFSAELPPRDQIELAVVRLHDVLSNNKPYETIAEDVTKLLLLPVADHLGNKRLLVVGSGVLEYLPFAALPSPSSITQRARPLIPLIAEHVILYAPSASALAALRDAGMSETGFNKGAAVLADPVFERSDVRFHNGPRSSAPAGNVQISSLRSLQRGLRETGGSSFGRLVFTRAEARAIANAVGSAGVKTALDFEASRATATNSDLSQYKVIHFATHGILDNVHPELSGVVLSLFNEKGEPQDGFLRLYEIYALNLPVQLVVLSACETGLGKDVRGEGMVSLTRGFMYAGAQRVVVTTWAVHDQATAEMMKRFYRGMFHDHLPAAAALRIAQLELSSDKRWRSPYYWAGFQIQGDWR